jgi:hypothetical protein
LRSPRIARRAAAVAAALGVLAFWCGLLLAARRYPSEYDWRYITISSLVYPDRNPAGWLWARGGLVLCGLAGLNWALTLRREGRGSVARGSPGIGALALGYTCMVACALVPEWRIGIPKLHECLAVAAFVGICLGMAGITWRVSPLGARRTGLPGSARSHAAILVGVVLSPILLAAVAQIWASDVLHLPWVNLGWRARGVPVYLSFAFWEWIGCGVFSAYMLLLPRVSLAR